MAFHFRPKWRPSRLLGCVITLIILCSNDAAYAESVSNVVKRFGWIGAWAPSCSDLPSLKNTWTYVAAADGAGVEVAWDSGFGPMSVGIVEDAVMINSNALQLRERKQGKNWGASDGIVFDVLITLENDRIRTTESVGRDGRQHIEGGVVKSSGQPTTWLSRCWNDVAVSTSIKLSPNSSQTEQYNALREADLAFQSALQTWGSGTSPGSEFLLDRAFAIRELILGPADGKVAQVLERFGALSFNRRSYVEAESRFRKALDIYVSAGGEKQIPVAALMGDLGASLREQGKLKEAQKTVEHSVALRRELVRPNDSLIAGGLNNLGRIYLAERRFADARRALDESLRITEAAAPQNLIRIRENQRLLQNVDTAEGRYRHLLFLFLSVALIAV